MKFIAALFFMAVVFASGDAWVQVREPKGGYPDNMAELDGLLANQRWDELTALLRNVEGREGLVKQLNWERERLLDGAPLYIALAYVRDLWRGGADTQETAGNILLYTYTLVVLDGIKCADASAPEVRMEAILRRYRTIWLHLLALPEDKRRQFIDFALETERITAPHRTPDTLLCRQGADEMRFVLEKNPDAAREVPTPEGHAGRTTALPWDPDYKPKFLDESEWRPKQEAARAALPARLAELMKLRAP